MVSESASRKEDFFRMQRLRYQRGSLSLRGKRNKVWVGRWREDIPQPNGSLKRIHRREILGTFEDYPSKRLAHRLLDTKLGELNSFTYKPAHAATFRDFSKRWMEMIVPTHKPSSQVGEKAHNNKWLVPFFGDLPLKHITPEVVQRFVSTLPALAPKTVRNIIATFRNMMETAVVWNYITTNPVSRVKLPENAPAERECFTEEQIQMILRAAPEPLKTFLWMAAETGLRGGELCGLRVPDLDLNNKTISVRQSAWRGKLQTPKTPKAIRRFALSTSLCDHLRTYLLESWQKNEQEILFPSKAGTPQDNTNVVKLQLRPLLEALKLPTLGLHAFRHTSASIMDAMNVPLKTRTDRLGHADPLLTLRTYTHAIPEEDRKVAEELGSRLSPSLYPISA